MACIELDYNDYFSAMEKKLGDQRVLLHATMVLTERCNLRCVHCFVHDPAQDSHLRSKELKTEQWLRILDQLADAGCLWLLLTGGEPLLRPDFADLYRYAKRKGFLITLFTNGTLLTPRLVNLLADWYPLLVEVSLYGATRDTYETITGVRGSFQRCLSGIRLLVEAQLPLRLKTVAIKPNQHELESLYGLAAELGVPFRHDGMLWQTFGGRDISHLRLPAAEVVALDRFQPGIADDLLRNYHRAQRNAGSGSDYQRRLYRCGAGFRSCSIDASGRLHLCQMDRSAGHDLASGEFQIGWRELDDLRKRRVSKDFECLHCDLAAGMCLRCPAFSTLEHGDPEAVVEFACAIARLRAAELGLNTQEGTAASPAA